MTKNETIEILKRIKSNYQDFIVDEYKTKEWCKELKDYDFEDVMNKIEEHLRSEDYGKFPPKLYFLTKYLKKTSEKAIKTNYKLECRICGEYVPEAEYDNHFDRCMDINYMARIQEKYFNKKTPKENIQKLKELSQEKFEVGFLEFLNKVYDKVPKEEQDIIFKIINTPKNKKFDLGDEEE